MQAFVLIPKRRRNLQLKWRLKVKAFLKVLTRTSLSGEHNSQFLTKTVHLLCGLQHYMKNGWHLDYHLASSFFHIDCIKDHDISPEYKEAATSTFPDNLDRVWYNDYVLQVIVLQGTLQVTISGVNRYHFHCTIVERDTLLAPLVWLHMYMKVTIVCWWGN